MSPRHLRLHRALPVQWHFRHAALVFCPCRSVLRYAHADAKEISGHVFQSQRAGSRVHQPTGNHGVKGNRFHRHAMIGKHQEIVFNVMPHFLNSPVGQDGQQSGAHLFQRELPGVMLMSHRDIPASPLTYGKRDAYQFRLIGRWRWFPYPAPACLRWRALSSEHPAQAYPGPPEPEFRLRAERPIVSLLCQRGPSAQRRPLRRLKRRAGAVIRVRNSSSWKSFSTSTALMWSVWASSSLSDTSISVRMVARVRLMYAESRPVSSFA